MAEAPTRRAQDDAAERGGAVSGRAHDERCPIRFRGHLPALDGVRGLAILLVLFHHLWPYEWSNPITSALTRVSHAGWIGVDLFFVLSGFLITGILIDSRGRERYFRTFIARRSLRIFPLYFLFLGIAFGVLPAVLSWIGHPDPVLEENRGALPWFLAYMSNHLTLFTDPVVTSAVGSELVDGLEHGLREFLAITWSLSVEEQFYLVWPAVVLLFASRMQRVAIVLVLLAVASRVAAFLLLYDWPHVTNMALFCRMDSLVVGAALAAWVRHDDPETLSVGVSIEFLDGSGALIGRSERSLVHATAPGYRPLTVQGTAHHSSMPQASDAPRVLSVALGRLAELELEPRILPATDAFLDRVSDRMPFVQRLALKNRWLLGPVVHDILAARPASNAMIRDTFALTMLEAGVKDNVVPARAQATFNLRLLPGSSRAEVLAQMERRIDDPRVQIDVLQDDGDSPPAPIEGEVWTRLESALASAYPAEGTLIAPMITPGTMDARFFAARGVPTYRLIPFVLDANERGRMHGIDERISIENLEEAARVYAYVMRYW